MIIRFNYYILNDYLLYNINDNRLNINIYHYKMINFIKLLNRNFINNKLKLFDINKRNESNIKKVISNINIHKNIKNIFIEEKIIIDKIYRDKLNRYNDNIKSHLDKEESNILLNYINISDHEIYGNKKIYKNNINQIIFNSFLRSFIMIPSTLFLLNISPIFNKTIFIILIYSSTRLLYLESCRQFKRGHSLHNLFLKITNKYQDKVKF